MNFISLKSSIAAIFLFINFIIASSSSQEPLQIECDFNIQVVMIWNKEVYGCNVRNNFQMNFHQEVVTKVHGNHLRNKENQNVHSLQFVDKNLKFFPRGIENFFYRLAVLTVENSKLSKIHQSDLIAFTNLKVLQLPSNELQYLEKDLFTYNPKLEIINLKDNPIQKVHPDVFDYLENLRYLSFEHNYCVNEMADNREDVKHLIQTTKDKCGDFDFDKLINIERYENATKAEILKLKQLNFEKTQQNQNLSQIIDELKYKMESKHHHIRLIFLIVLMIVLIILTVLIVGVVLFLLKQKREVRKEPDTVKLPAIPYNRSVAENIYEDIRPGRNEPVYDRLDHF